MTPEARRRQRVRFPVLALTAGAWIALLVVGMPHGGSAAHEAAGLPSLAGTGWAHHAGQLLSSSSAGPSPGLLIAGSALMLVAMMAPLLIPALRHVSDRSLPYRRRRAVTLLVAGYAVTWSVAWVLLLTLAAAITRFVPHPAAALGCCLGVLIAWQVSPLKQRFLNRSHSRPTLVAFGPAADADALRYGHTQAKWCIGSCWALMLVPLLVPTQQLLVMLAVAGWIWAERWEAPAPATWRVRLPVSATRLVTAQTRSRLEGIR